MSEDQGQAHDGHNREKRAERRSALPAQPGAGLEGLPAPELAPSYPGSLLGDPRLNGRGNQPVKIALMRQMQQMYGNRAVQRALRSQGMPITSTGGDAQSLAQSSQSQESSNTTLDTDVDHQLTFEAAADPGPFGSDFTNVHIQRQQAPAAQSAQQSNVPGQEGQTWEQTGNLRGNPPVRSRTDPPNKNVVEDEQIFAQRLLAAKAALKRQIERANKMLKGEVVTDYRYWFAKVYTYVTENEIQFALNKAYYYPSYVMASVLYFEQLFQDNFKAFEDKGPVEDHWRKAFQQAQLDQVMAKVSKPLVVVSPLAAIVTEIMHITDALVTSMQAHIRFDLPRAEAWVYNTYYRQYPSVTISDFREDFMSMSGVFDNAGRQMNVEIARRTGVPAHLMGSLIQDTAMRHAFDADMATERADTWVRAEELVNSNMASPDPYSLSGGRLQGNVTSADNLSGLQKIPTERLRPSMDQSVLSESDSAIRKKLGEMSDAEVQRIPTTLRMQLIRRLLKGATGGADETLVLRILDVSLASDDIVTLVDGSDAWDMMYALDGKNAQTLRAFLRKHYYAHTVQQTAMRLIQKCLDGETAEWEEEMVIDLLETRSDGRALIKKVGEIYGGASKDSYKNGLNKLEWQLDGAEEVTLHQLFGKSKTE